MKKVFAFLAIAAMIVACGEKDPQPGPNNENKGNEEQNPNGEEQPPVQEYVCPITIDGEFADWAGLDEATFAEAKGDPDAPHTALKVMKLFADELFVFIYFEWDKDQITHEPDVEHVPFHIYINGDGDATTGGFADQFSDACTDVLMEGFIYPDGASIGSYEPGLFGWNGDPNGSGWTWDDLGEIAGITSGAGIEGKYELMIMRELYPLGTMADNASFGIDIQQGWNSVGVLPNAAVTDDNPGGHAPSLAIKVINK